MIIVEITCPFCGAMHSVCVPAEEYDAWQGGELAQNALVSLSAEEREQLISGMCPRCQAEIFG